MVKKGVLLLVMLSVCSLLCASVAIHGTTYYTSGVSFGQVGTTWRNAAGVQLSLATEGNNTVKAVFSGSYDLGSATIIGGGTTYHHVLSLDKAYVRFRFPFASGRYVRMTVGKSPMAWGFGTYFNAADLIFGSKPNNVQGGVGSSDFRTSTTYLVDAQVPLGDRLTAQLAFFPPIEQGSDMRLGGRFVWDVGTVPLDALQASYMWNIDRMMHSVALALDGTVWVDYQLGVSTGIGSDPATDAYDNLQFSLGVSKVFWMGDVPLSVMIDALAQPASDSYDVFADIRITPLQNMWVGGMFLLGIQKNLAQLTSVLHLGGTPLQGLSVQVQGGLVVNWTDDVAYVGIVALSCQYAF